MRGRGNCEKKKNKEFGNEQKEAEKEQKENG